MRASQQARLEAVRSALRQVVDPCSIATGVPLHLEDMGLVRDLRCDESGNVTISLRLTSPFCAQWGNIRERVELVVRSVGGVNSVDVEVDDGNEWVPQMMSLRASRMLRALRPMDEAS